MERRTVRQWALLGLVGLVVAGAVVAAADRGGPRAGDRASSTPSGKAAAPSTGGGRAAADTGGLTADEAAATGAPAPVGASVGGSAAQPQAVPQAGPKIVKRAELRVEVRRSALTRAFDAAASVAARAGGFVASSSMTGGEEDSKAATLTIRVPADRFDTARRELAALGKVKGEQISGDDVTSQLVDFDARIRSLQAQEDALRTLLGRATRVGEVLEIQGQLFNVRQQIEQLQAQRSQLDDAASLSTITVSLFEPGVSLAQPEPETGLAHDLSRAWDGAIAVIGGMIVVVGYATPLVLLALLVWLVVRLTRRRGAPPAAVPAA